MQRIVTSVANVCWLIAQSACASKRTLNVPYVSSSSSSNKVAALLVLVACGAMRAARPVAAADAMCEGTGLESFVVGAALGPRAEMLLSGWGSVLRKGGLAGGLHPSIHPVAATWDVPAAAAVGGGLLHCFHMPAVCEQ